MLRNGLFAMLIGFLGGAGLMANAATNIKAPLKISYVSIDKLMPSVEKSEEQLFNLKGVGKRCVEKSQTCRFYHSGYYYETPWWTAPEII